MQELNTQIKRKCDSNQTIYLTMVADHTVHKNKKHKLNQKTQKLSQIIQANCQFFNFNPQKQYANPLTQFADFCFLNEVDPLTQFANLCSSAQFNQQAKAKEEPNEIHKTNPKLKYPCEKEEPNEIHKTNPKLKYPCEKEEPKKEPNETCKKNPKSKYPTDKIIALLQSTFEKSGECIFPDKLVSYDGYSKNMEVASEIFTVLYFTKTYCANIIHKKIGLNIAKLLEGKKIDLVLDKKDIEVYLCKNISEFSEKFPTKKQSLDIFKNA
jgi:hypothetical protein